MATTKFSVSAYTADGVTTDFLITWDYLDEDHIAVYVDGTPNYDPTSTYTFEQINATTLRITDEFGNAVPSGSAIEIRRETPIATRAVTFVDGSSFLAEDLNKNSDYLLYSMQEALDTVEAAAQDGALAAQVATEALRDETQVLRDETEVLKDTAGTYLATVQADATAADNHRIAAAASEAAAATSETNAATSETNAAASATASATSAANALASEQASATSEAAALASQQAAETAEIGAAASATAAATSETNAAASATAAATSETNAAATLASVEGIYDQFDDRYLGPKATDPVTDNDGNPLVQGTLYFSTSENVMKVYDGANWDAATSAGGASLLNYNFTATAGQTAFSGVDDNAQTLSYAQNNIIVTLNGITLEDGTDYTATDGVTITLTSAAAAGDELNIIAFKTFAVADTVSASNGGTFSNPITINRATSDGTIIDLQKDGSSVGSIGTPFTGELYIQATGANSSGLLFTSGNTIQPRKNSAADDGNIDIGTGGNRFKNLYLSGGVYLGGTGAANYLDDYEEGTWTVTVTSGTVSNFRQATYTKIGNIVHCQVAINTFSDTSSSNAVQINLPFVPFSNDRSTIGMSVLSANISGINDMNGYLESGNVVRFYASVTGVSGYDYLKHSDLGSGAVMYVGFSYFAA
ncbi:hypothetical protein CRP804_gp35 [Roseobacter phage CRP-804]|uniref:Bacteriophage T7 tail fibre protein-like N-terminal domain-containing protein n=1 Tax=Roseobacter phage CRP-804 TaxID=3072850 RepID=A0AAX3ZWF9_9CAUD|nr:hypothetical protein CRP804_gp35 [Roseobacter phage CRP-804]